MIISGTNDSVAQICADPHNKYANVYGTDMYTTGTHTWQVRVRGDEMNTGYMLVGVATLPQGDIDNSTKVFSGRGTGWDGDGVAFSNHAGQYGTARTAAWQDGDILTFTFDCDAGTLQLHVQRTGERKVITDIDIQGKQFYFFVSIWYKYRQVEIP
eukprot:scpid75586/ scgid15092/ 